MQLPHYSVTATAFSLAWFLHCYNVDMGQGDTLMGFLPLAHVYERLVLFSSQRRKASSF